MMMAQDQTHNQTELTILTPINPKKSQKKDMAKTHTMKTGTINEIRDMDKEILLVSEGMEKE
jgi:hypothetical protein